jgi:hypothetical protein
MLPCERHPHPSPSVVEPAHGRPTHPATQPHVDAGQDRAAVRHGARHRAAAVDRVAGRRPRDRRTQLGLPHDDRAARSARRWRLPQRHRGDGVHGGPRRALRGPARDHGGHLPRRVRPGLARRDHPVLHRRDDRRPERVRRPVRLRRPRRAVQLRDGDGCRRPRDHDAADHRAFERGDAQARPRGPAGGVRRARGAQVADHHQGRSPERGARPDDRRDAGGRTCRRRDRGAAADRARLAAGRDRPLRDGPVLDHVAHLPGRQAALRPRQGTCVGRCPGAASPWSSCSPFIARFITSRSRR